MIHKKAGDFPTKNEKDGSVPRPGIIRVP